MYINVYNVLYTYVVYYIVCRTVQRDLVKNLFRPARHGVTTACCKLLITIRAYAFEPYRRPYTHAAKTALPPTPPTPTTAAVRTRVTRVHVCACEIMTYDTPPTTVYVTTESDRRGGFSRDVCRFPSDRDSFSPCSRPRGPGGFSAFSRAPAIRPRRRRVFRPGAYGGDHTRVVTVSMRVRPDRHDPCDFVRVSRTVFRFNRKTFITCFYFY